MLKGGQRVGARRACWCARAGVRGRWWSVGAGAGRRRVAGSRREARCGPVNLLGLSLAWMGGGDGWVVCVGGVRGGGASETGARAIAMPSYREPQQPSAHTSTAAHRLATTEVISCVGARARVRGGWTKSRRSVFFVRDTVFLFVLLSSSPPLPPPDSHRGSQVYHFVGYTLPSTAPPTPPPASTAPARQT